MIGSTKALAGLLVHCRVNDTRQLVGDTRIDLIGRDGYLIQVFARHFRVEASEGQFARQHLI